MPTRFPNVEILKEISSWRKKWSDFWTSTWVSDPRTVWHFIRRLLGRTSSEAPDRTPAEICFHFEQVGMPQNDKDFCLDCLQEAQIWIRENTKEQCPFSSDLIFSVQETTSSFEKLNNSALGLDGLSKAIFSPILPLIAPVVASFFTALLRSSVAPRDWQIAILTVIKKKGSSRKDLDNFRAVHILNL